MSNMTRKALAGAAIAGISALAFASPAYAGTEGAPPGDFKVQAWAHEHKDAIKLFLGVDVDTCKGLDGLTFKDAVDLAKAQHVDLNKLIDQADPEAMLNYVKNSGVTYAQLKDMLNSFCSQPAKHPTEHPTDPAKNGDDNPGDAGSEKAPDKKPSKEDLADTGSNVDPWLLGGGAALVIGSGAGITALARRKWQR